MTYIGMYFGEAMPDKQATESLKDVLTPTATHSHIESIQGSSSELWENKELEEAGVDTVVLEYPVPLGTEEFNHFMVFNIYDGIEAALNADDFERYVDVESDEFTGRLVGGGVGAGAGFVVGRTLISKVGKVPAPAWLKGLTLLTITGAGLYAGEELGAEAADATQSQEDIDAVKRVEDLRKELAQGVLREEGEILRTTGRTARFGKAAIKQKEVIALYMPQKINKADALDYEMNDLATVQNAMFDWVGLGSRIVLGKIPGAVDTIANVFGVNTNIDTAIQAGLRIAPNPRKQLIFNEPAPRRYEFSFNFFPRNEYETARAYEIIKTFKKYAYPALNKIIGQGAFYTFPAEFEIKYYTVQGKEAVENDWLPKMGRCALREISVDYTSSGTYATFENGAPVMMSLSLTFEEMELMDRDLIEKGY